MNKDIRINVTGGTVSIGAVHQGDRGKVSGSATAAAAAMTQEFDRAGAALGALAREQARSQEELQGLLAEVEKLKLAAQAAHPDPQAGSGILKTVRENFGWAYPAVKDLAQAVWPALLALVAG